MARAEQVLHIEPEGDLRFRGPFTGAPVTSYINLSNPSTNNVYFKIKTTAPKRYCVRPNNGVLIPKQSAQIAVCLQPHEFDPNEKNKHKFMVQTVVVPEGDDHDNLRDVWKDTNPSQVMDYKLKCVFENPVSNTTTAKPTAAPAAAAAPDSTANGKNKATGDTAKSPSKPQDETEEKLKKAAQEVVQLRVEESKLRQEYLELKMYLMPAPDQQHSLRSCRKCQGRLKKEEMIKWRTAAKEKGVNVASSTRMTSPSPVDAPLIPMTSTSMIIAALMVIVGYFLGKLI